MTSSLRQCTIQPKYTLRGQALHKVSKVKCLGVTLALTLEWNMHINNSMKKAKTTIDVLKRNLKGVSVEVRETAYKTMVQKIVVSSVTRTRRSSLTRLRWYSAGLLASS